MVRIALRVQRRPGSLRGLRDLHMREVWALHVQRCPHSTHARDAHGFEGESEYTFSNVCGRTWIDSDEPIGLQAHASVGIAGHGVLRCVCRL